MLLCYFAERSAQTDSAFPLSMCVASVVAVRGDSALQPDLEDEDFRPPTWKCTCIQRCTNTFCYPDWAWMRWFEHRMRRPAQWLTDKHNREFSGFMTGVITVNTIVLASYHDGMSEEFNDTVELINNICAVVFVFEMLALWTAHGLASYFGKPFNVLDFLVVVASIVEFVATSGPGGVSVLRLLRIFRLVKLLLRFEALKHIFKVAVRAGRSFGWLALLLVLFIFVYVPRRTVLTT